MRGKLTAAVVLVASSIPATGGASLEAASSRHCHPDGTRLVLNRKHVTVFSFETRDGPREYACVKPNGPLLAMAESDGIYLDVPFPPPAVSISGRAVGWAVNAVNEDTGPVGGGRVTLIERGRYFTPGESPHRRGWATATAPKAGYWPNSRVGSLVVRPSRSVAWISCRPLRFNHGRETCDKSGQPDTVYFAPHYYSTRHKLAVGSDIDPRSLRRDGDRVSWKQGGHRRSAPFPP